MNVFWVDAQKIKYSKAYWTLEVTDMHQFACEAASLLAPLLFAVQRRRRVHRSLACAWLRVHAGSLTTKIPSNPASNLARARDHKRRQEQHAMDSSLLAAMASAGDESPGGDGTMNRGGLRAETEPADPRTDRDRACATGDDYSRGSTEKRYGFMLTLEFVIWCLDLILDALKHIDHRIRQERTLPA